MTRDAINRNLEIFAVLLFSVSVFLWKPGIYVSSSVIISYMMVRSATDAAYLSELRSCSVMRVSLALFVFGLITSAIAMQQADDFLWMARKTLFLPVAGFLFIALQKTQNRKAALTGLFIGFWVAAIITLAENWTIIGKDFVVGTWPKGTWDALLGLCFVFLLLFLIGQRHGVVMRLFVALCALCAFILLLLSGGRGPFLATVCAVCAYLVLFKVNVRLLVSIVAMIAVLTGGSVIFFKDKTQYTIKQLTSLTDFKDGSNWIRLKLWGIGYEHIKETGANRPMALLFGGGSKSYDETQIEFFETLPYDEDDRRRLKEFGYPSGDAHNNYIDSTLRNGLLWTFAAFAYLAWLTTRFKMACVLANPAPLAMFLYMLVLGMVYTVVPHFITFFFVFFVALLATGLRKEPDTEPAYSKSTD